MSAAEAITLFKNFFRSVDGENTVIMAGDTVRKVGGEAIGIVEFIDDSPYWGETVERAYVIFDHGVAGLSSDYLLAEEIELVKV